MFCGALGAEAEKAEEFGDVDEGFGLLAFLGGEGLAAVLEVEQMLEAGIDRGGQAEFREVIRHFEADLDGAAHRLCAALRCKLQLCIRRVSCL